ncbi:MULTISPECIES: arylesterase [Pseudooceanicola]|nr:MULTISPECIES: arylesterase [Pseudooceanicola]
MATIFVTLAGFWPGMAAAQTLLAFGDSLTQGYGLAQDKGLVPQLQAWLKDHGRDVTVVNGGVSGDTTQGGLARIDWSLTPEVNAVMVILGGNDLLRGTDPAVTQVNLDGILKAITDRHLPVLLVGMQASENYGAAYKRQFDAIYPALAHKYGTEFLPSYYAGITPDGTTSPAAMQSYLQADGLHPNAAGVTNELTQLGPKVLALLDRAEP